MFFAVVIAGAPSWLEFSTLLLYLLDMLGNRVEPKKKLPMIMVEPKKIIAPAVTRVWRRRDARFGANRAGVSSRPDVSVFIMIRLHFQIGS